MIEMAAKKKLFLIAGHGEGDPGACSIWGQEANYTRELAKLVKTAIGSRMSVTLYDTNKNCYAQSKRGNVPAYSDYDMTVEIHFNAKAKADPNGDGRFTGVGGYIHPNNAGRSIAKMVFHLRMKRVKYWDDLIVEVHDLLQKWRDSDADRSRRMRSLRR